MPGARCARSRTCRVVNTCVSHHGHTGITRHSPRDGLQLIPRSPRRPGFFATVAKQNDFRQLDASVGASGPHVFAVRLSAVRQRHRHVHRIPHPTFVTTAKRPSYERGVA